MVNDETKFIYKDGVRFEVTTYGLVCCLEEAGCKKHECPDCRFCQWCSPSRCSGCLDQPGHEGEVGNGNRSKVENESRDDFEKDRPD
jgi:hypothetical protein